ncbi:TetR/AcrR family transcriptional regulator, partial [Dietzia sp. SLG310A2-38A2]|nr:TetR/AcrR family transcriptional regulator [Dietzia sp. SLG310A2-38A2]
GHDPGDVRVRRPLQATLDLARGLGLADVLSDDSARREKVIRYWAETLDLVLAQVPQASARGAAPAAF